MRETCEDETVGYGKPPKKTRFQKGRSGNPKGRPRRKLSDAEHSTLRKVLNEKVTITVAGRRRKATHSEVAAIQLVAQAAQGKAWAVKAVVQASEEFDNDPRNQWAKAPWSKRDFIKAQFYMQGLYRLEAWLIAGGLLYRSEGGFLELSRELCDLIERGRIRWGLEVDDLKHWPPFSHSPTPGVIPIGYAQSTEAYVENIESAPDVAVPHENDDESSA